jgi:hypothetical protein
MAKRKLKTSQQVKTEQENREKNDELDSNKTLKSERDTDLMELKDGKFMTTVGLQTYLQPKFSLCNMCPAAPRNQGDCEEYIHDSECTIEKNISIVIFKTFADMGITDEDRLIVDEYIQMHLNAVKVDLLNSYMNDNRLFDDNINEKMMYLSEKKTLMKFRVDFSKSKIQLLKELRATRKERERSVSLSKNKIQQKNFFEIIEDVDEE